ncbi:MAG: family 1 encapsulin nanocompartment shell protein [Alphaproteobacteria bacterium]
MNNLLRELAPISAAAWKEIDEEARRTLKLTLAARKLVDFVGPLGWDACAVSLGRTEPVKPSWREGIESRLRRVQPLVELRVPFELPRSEFEAIERGSKDAELEPVIAAARAIAIAEDAAVFHGHPGAGIKGIGEAAEKAGLTLTDDYTRYPIVVAEALSKLRNDGVAGPYGIALGPRCYTGLTETTTSGGYRVFDHVERLLDGPVVWAPGVDGAVVMSLRGGDFELTVGQDFSIGYLDHTATTVRLYLQESFTFRVLAAEAAVPLSYRAAKK